MVWFSFRCCCLVGGDVVMLVWTHTMVYLRKNGKMMPHKGTLFCLTGTYFRYSEALLASDPLLEENDSEEE